MGEKMAKDVLVEELLDSAVRAATAFGLRTHATAVELLERTADGGLLELPEDIHGKFELPTIWVGGPGFGFEEAVEQMEQPLCHAFRLHMPFYLYGLAHAAQWMGFDEKALAGKRALVVAHCDDCLHLIGSLPQGFAKAVMVKHADGLCSVRVLNGTELH